MSSESPPRAALSDDPETAVTPPGPAGVLSSTPHRVPTPVTASLSPYSQQQQRRFNNNNNISDDLNRPLLLNNNNASTSAASPYLDLDDFGRPRLPFHIVLLRTLFKSINLLLLITGIAMLGAAADELVRFRQTAPPEVAKRAPWFLFAVGGTGAAIALTASLGLAGASASSGRRWMRRRRRGRGRGSQGRIRRLCRCCCCSPAPSSFLLGFYAAVLSSLLVCQVALALALSADASWRRAHLPEDPTGDEEAIAALVARQLVAARALAALALALQLANVGIAGALGSAHVSALEAAAEGRAFVVAAAQAQAQTSAARESSSYLDDEPGWGATPAPRLPSSPARGTFIPIGGGGGGGGGGGSPDLVLPPPSMYQQQQEAGSRSGGRCLLM